MPKKKSANTIKTANKKKSTTKKAVEKKVKAKTSKKKEEINPSDLLQKENENLLKSLITKEFDKELTEKSADSTLTISNSSALSIEQSWLASINEQSIIWSNQTQP